MVDQNDVGADLPENAPDQTDPEFWADLLGGDATAARIVQDHDISEAIRGGRMRVLYELLRKRSRAAESAPERDALTALVQNRRWFVDPTQGAPGMSRINGIGTTLQGSAEKGRDGTHIATLIFTFIFIPIWPICEYLVKSAGSEGFYFLGRVPMSKGNRFMRRLILGCVVGTVLLISFRVWNRQTHDDVSFLNGLDFAVTVDMGGKKIEIRPDGRAEREFSSGDYHVVARDPEGVVIEERDVTVPGGHDIAVYSVLGAAPLMSNVVGYGSDNVDVARVEAASSWKSLAGPSWFQREDVDFAWHPAPENIKMRKRSGIEVRSQVEVMTGGWRAAVMHLSNQGDDGEAAALARRVALLRPGELDSMLLAYQYTMVSGDEPAARALVEKAIEATPGSIEAHRLYQSHHQQQGETDVILPRYKAAYEREPDSAYHGYLYSRLAPFDEAETILTRLVALHPDHPWIRRGAAWSTFHRGRWTAAVTHCTKGMELQPDAAGWFAVYAARAACADGRVDDGLEALRRILNAAPALQEAEKDMFAGGDAWSLVHTYSCLRDQTSSTHPALADVLKPIIDDEAERADLLARLAAFRRDRKAFEMLKHKVQDKQGVRHCELTLLSRENLAEAARLARTTEAEMVQGLDDVARLLIACELLHGGHSEQAKAAFETLSAEVRASLTFPQVESVPELDGLDDALDPDLRSVLHYVAHLRSESDEAKAKHLAEARRFDTLGIVVPD